MKIDTDDKDSHQFERKFYAGRRFDIDWLRIVLFGLLIGYHYLLFAPPTPQFDFPETYRGLNFTLRVLEQWRLTTLFVISGMGTAFAFQNRSTAAYLKERLQRLLIPLLFVVYVVGAGLLTPWMTTVDLLSGFPSIKTTAHMWFVYNLLVYAVVSTPLFRVMQQDRHGRWRLWHSRLLFFPAGVGLLLWPPLLLAAVAAVTKPWAAELYGNGWKFIWFWLYFLLGYGLMINRPLYFERLERLRWPLTILTPLLAWLFYGSLSWLAVPQLREGGWVALGVAPLAPAALVGSLIQAFHAWFWSLFLFAWAAHLLNRPGRGVVYLNRAIYPIYIIHQPLIYGVVVALGGVPLPAWSKDFLVGPLLVAGLAVGIYELVRRGRWTRLLFGIKPSPAEDGPPSTAPQGLRPWLVYGLTGVVLLILAIGQGLYWGLL